MGLLHQTKFLLRKNYLTKRRNLRQTLQEVIIPIWWILILFVIKLSVRTKELPAVKDSEIPVATISQQGPVSFGPSGNSSRPIVGYVTNDVPNARQAIDLIKNSNSAVNFMEFNSTGSMLDYYKDYSESRGFAVGIEFSKGKNVGLAYTLRVNKKLFPDPEKKLYGKFKGIRKNRMLSLSVRTRGQLAPFTTRKLHAHGSLVTNFPLYFWLPVSGSPVPHPLRSPPGNLYLGKI